MGRRLRTRLDLLHPDPEKKVQQKQAQQQKYHDVHSKARVFEVGQSVLARNYYGISQSVESYGSIATLNVR